MFKDKLNRFAAAVGFDVDSDEDVKNKLYAFAVLVNFERTRELMPLMKALMLDEIDACAALCDDLDLPEAARLLRARTQTVQIDGDLLAIRQLRLDVNREATPL
jgi:hypothetical protein